MIRDLMDERIDERYRCTATAKGTGERCRRAAIPGGSICFVHGGAAPQTRDAARRRLERIRTEGQVAALLDELGPIDGDPHEVLLDTVSHSAAMAELLRILVGGLAPNYDPEIVDSAGRATAALWGPDHLGDARPHPLVALLGEWTDRAARTAKIALAAGIAEQRVQVLTDQGRLIAGVLQGSLRVLFAQAVERLVAAGADQSIVAAVVEEVRRESGVVVRQQLLELAPPTDERQTA
jgi:hypothetical protein